MAKLFILFAMCFVATLATGSNIKLAYSAERTFMPLSQISSMLAPIDKHHSECVSNLKAGLIEDFKNMVAASHACVENCKDEVMKIHEDVWNSLQAAHAAVVDEVKNLRECNNKECVWDSLKEIKNIIHDNVANIHEIIATGVKAIKEKYPDAYECTMGTFVQLDKDFEDTLNAFVECISSS